MATCELCGFLGFPMNPAMWIVANRWHKDIMKELMAAWKSRGVTSHLEWQGVQELWEQMWEDINGS